MIRYALNCANGHNFDSWFASSAACDGLIAAGRVTCISCGSTAVEKALMAPAVGSGAATPEPVAEPKPATLSQPQSELEAKIAALRREIEANSEYVGLNFASEARAIHAGEAPERAIFGEAKVEEARALIEEGVPVAPLPFLPARKIN